MLLLDKYFMLEQSKEKIQFIIILTTDFQKRLGRGKGSEDLMWGIQIYSIQYIIFQAGRGPKYGIMV